MKIRITKGAAIAGVLTFTLASCDPERNKASAGGSADTVFTESAKHLDSARRQTTIDTPNTKRDSTTNSGNADPSGRVKNQGEH
ncbi:hypothetical protein [Mucilaginibacter sp. HD30]